MRSCYESKWRLFYGHPEIETPGRYVIAPPGVPDYPGPHNYGSRNWTSDERVPEPLLGEISGNKRPYSNGEPDGDIPGPGLLGSANCIEFGETWPLPLIVRDLATGFDSRCPQFPQTPVVAPIAFPNVLRCRDQKRLAEILWFLYNATSADAVIAMQNFRPAAVVTGVNNTAAAVPGTVIAIEGDTTIVVIAGTTNPTQWALQIASGLVVQANQGNYSTLAFWQVASNLIINRINLAGSVGTGPLILVGHSFGAALACIIAVLCKQAHSNRSIQLLTFGCPKPGDNRLITLMAGIPQVHFVNDDDVIPYIPPSGPEIVPFVGLLPSGLIRAYAAWGRLTNRVGLSELGVRTDNPDIETIYGLVWRLLWGIVFNHLPPVFTAHGMSIYWQRIICPADPAPGPIPEDAFLGNILWWRNDEITGLPLGTDILVWPDVSGYLNDGLDGGLGAHVTRANALGGIPAGLFAGDCLLKTEVPFHLGSTMTAFVAFQPIGSLGNKWGPALGSLNPALNFTVTAPNGGILHIGQISWSDGVQSLDVLADYNPPNNYLYSVRRRIADVQAFVNGILVGSALAPLPKEMYVERLNINNTAAPNLRLCYLFEVLVFPFSLSDFDYATVTTYFRTKFGI